MLTEIFDCSSAIRALNPNYSLFTVNITLVISKNVFVIGFVVTLITGQVRWFTTDQSEVTLNASVAEEHLFTLFTCKANVAVTSLAEFHFTIDVNAVLFV